MTAQPAAQPAAKPIDKNAITKLIDFINSGKLEAITKVDVKNTELVFRGLQGTIPGTSIIFFVDNLKKPNVVTLDFSADPDMKRYFSFATISGLMNKEITIETNAVSVPGSKSFFLEATLAGNEYKLKSVSQYSKLKGPEGDMLVNVFEKYDPATGALLARSIKGPSFWSDRIDCRAFLGTVDQHYPEAANALKVLTNNNGMTIGKFCTLDEALRAQIGLPDARATIKQPSYATAK